jgi:hypothetical protein
MTNLAHSGAAAAHFREPLPGASTGSTSLEIG